MEAEEEDDAFASIIKFCQLTASQEAKFPNCPLSRESENFMDSCPDLFSSSSDRTPSNPTPIVMVSLPGSFSSVQHVEEEAVFHTPPEHHAHSHLSSSDDQNPNELRAEGVGVVDGPDRRNKVRVSEAGLDDEPEAKKIRVMEEKLDGETIPLGETVPVGETEVVHETEVVIIDIDDSDEEISTVNLGEDSLDTTCGGRKIEVAQKIDELKKDGMCKVLAVNGNHGLGKKRKSSEGNRVDKGEKSCEYSDLNGSLDSGRIEEEIVMLKRIAGSRCIEVEQKSDVGGSEKVVRITKDAEMPKDFCRNGGLETDDKRIEVIERETDCKRIEEICLKTDDKIVEVIGRETDGKKTEEIGLETDGKKVQEIGLQNDGKRTEETGLETDDKRIEESSQTDGKRIQEIGLETDDKRTEETGLETDGKSIEESGQTDGKRIQEIGLETDDKRTEEIDLETDGKRIEESGQTDGKTTREISLETDAKKIVEAGLISAGTRGEGIGLKTNGKSIEDIDEFRYTCGDDRKWKGRRRQLPVSLKGKEKEVVESAETGRGLFLDVVKAVVGDTNGGCEDVDFLETAKSRGLTFPKPRWWASERRAS